MEGGDRGGSGAKVAVEPNLEFSRTSREYLRISFPSRCEQLSKLHKHVSIAQVLCLHFLSTNQGMPQKGRFWGRKAEHATLHIHTQSKPLDLQTFPIMLLGVK